MLYFKTELEEKAFFDPILNENYSTLISWDSIGRLAPFINYVQKSSNKTAFMLAAEKGRVELLNFLLTIQGIDVNFKNAEGHSALSLAITHCGIYSVNRLLLDKRVIIDLEHIELARQTNFPFILDNLVKYKLFSALQTKNLKIIITLFEKNLLTPNLINEVMFEDVGFTPLMHAISLEDKETIAFLLKIPTFDINKKNKKKGSALDQVIFCSSDAIFNQILAAPNLYMEKVHLSIARKTDPLRAKKLNSLFIKPTPNIFVRLPDQIEFFCEMKQNGYAIPEIKDWVNTINKVNGMTPLMWAAYHGNLKILEYLLTIPGMDVNIQTEKKKSALFFAIENNQLFMVMELLKTGRIYLERDADSAIELAQSKQFRAIVTMIKEYLPKKEPSYAEWLDQHFSEQIFLDYLCPVSLEIMQDPITINTGFTFERKSLIHYYYKSGKLSCPYTQQPFKREELDYAPSILIKNRIQRYMEKRKKQWEARNIFPESNNIIQADSVVPSSLDPQNAFFPKPKKRKLDALYEETPHP